MVTEEKKRIILADVVFSRGGSGRVLSIVANYLTNNGYDVTLLAFDNDKVEYPLNDRIKFVFLDMPKGTTIHKCFSKIFELRTILKTQDCVVAFCFRPIFWITIASAFTGIRVIFSERNDPNKDPSSLIKRTLRNFCYYFADSIVFQTKGQMAYFSKIIRRKSQIIPNPVSNDLPRHDLKHCKNIIISASRLERQKNIFMAIDAFELFYREHKDYSFYIYGDGKLRNELEKYIIEKKMEECVYLMGFSKEIHTIIAESKIFVLSSDYEGVSNSMIEAMGIGIPVICTDCPIGGARELIQNEINGALVPVGDYRKMAYYMDKMVSEDSFCELLSENAMKVRESLAASKICNLWEREIIDLT